MANNSPEPYPGQDSLFDVPEPQKPASREYNFTPAIPPEQLAQMSKEHVEEQRLRAERDALRAIAAENKNTSFREMGAMRQGKVRARMLEAPVYSGMTDEAASSALDVFLKGSEEEARYIIFDAMSYYAESQGIEAKRVKGSDEPMAVTVDVIAVNPEQQQEFKTGFARFWSQYAGTRNSEANLARRKEIEKQLPRTA